MKYSKSYDNTNNTIDTSKPGLESLNNNNNKIKNMVHKYWAIISVVTLLEKLK